MNFLRKPLLLAAAGLLATTVFSCAAPWPAWRGPNGDGVCPEKGLPLHWSATENVTWRTPLPEPGNSTPIVWGDRIFVTQAVGPRRTLMCFARTDGRLLWQSGVEAKEADPTHATNPYCSASPVTDGERVIASFASEGLYCYDLSGQELWKRTDLGRQIHIWGNASSPMLEGDLCYLNFGPGELTYLLAVDKKTGQTVWRHDEETGYNKPPANDVKGGGGGNATFIGSWTTPTIMQVEGRPQLLMSWPRRLAAYDPRTGKEIWSCSGLNPLVYTSPIHDAETVVAMGGFGGAAIAVRAGGEGDVTSSRLVWQHARSPQRIGSGVVHEGRIYIHNDPGTAMCLDLKTGENVWTQRMQGAAKTGQNWSSVMLADGHCYTITQGGDCFVFKASPQFEQVAVNPLGERSNSSIVPSDGQLFIRTHRALYCIGQQKR